MSSVAARAPGTSIGGFLGVSVVWHALIILGLVVLTSRAPKLMPPIYKVDLIAAPAGPRVAGVVSPTVAAPKPDLTTPFAPAPPPPTPIAAPPAKSMHAAPVKAPPKVTPTPTPAPRQGRLQSAPTSPKKNTPAPVAGGGPNGGKGADVANVHTAGVDFPYPAYLQNIVRQIAANFSPDDKNKQLKAEVMFVIRRDGTVTGLRFTERSGDYAFDLEAQGAVEAVKNFGPLPDGFSEDALPVVFSFDPGLLH